MPQFDIASFYPQISFFAGIFLVCYVFLTQRVLPKMSRNLKSSKKITEIYNTFATFQSGPSTTGSIGAIAHIYNPSQILSYLIHTECLYIIYLGAYTSILQNAYATSLNWLIAARNSTRNRLSVLDRVYLNVLNDIYQRKFQL